MSEYMNKNESKYDDNNLNNEYRKIIHDIRNMKGLTKERIATIRKMSDDQKMQIIMIYNNVMEGFTYIVNGL